MNDQNKTKAQLIEELAALRQRVADLETAVAERNQVEKALREAEQRYRSLFERTNDAVFIFGLDKTHLEVNQQAADMLGCTIDEIVGRPVEDFLAPGEHATVDARVATIVDGQILSVYERIFRRKDGTEFPAEINAAVAYDAEGNPSHIHSIVRDVTARKQAEEALRESEEKYRILLDESADPIFSLAANGQYRFVNRAFAEGVGIPVEQITGNTMWDVFSQEEADIRFAALSEVFQTGVEKVIEVRVPRLDQDRFYMTTITPIKDSKGNVTNVICASKNITERKRAEQELAQERNFLNMVLENLPLDVYIKDTESRFLLANAATMRTLQVTSPEEYIGKTDVDFMPQKPEESVERLADEQRIIQTGEPLLNNEQSGLDRDGVPCWSLTSKLPMRDTDGNITGILGIGLDITDRKQAEEALAQDRNLLRTLIDNMPVDVYVKDTEGRFVVINAATAQLLGVATPEEAVGKTDFDFHSPELAELFYADEQELILSGQTIINRDESYVNPMTGIRGTLLITKVPLRDNNGEIVGIVGINCDITERKQAEAERLALVAERERVKVLGDFIGATSQEFRTPLSVINASLYLLEKVTEPEKCAEQVKVLKGQVTHIRDLVEAMLTMSRLDSGVEFNLVLLDVNGLLRDIANRLCSLAEEKQITCALELGDALPVVQGDHQYLHQALTHLAQNAVQYTPAGGTVTTRTYTRNGSVVVEISDTGVGIDEAHWPHIFERFYRADQARTDRGAGLGLSIAQKIVEMHGGRIEVESAPGVGSTFRALLPINAP